MGQGTTNGAGGYTSCQETSAMEAIKARLRSAKHLGEGGPRSKNGEMAIVCVSSFHSLTLSGGCVSADTPADKPTPATPLAAGGSASADVPAVKPIAPSDP